MHKEIIEFAKSIYKTDSFIPLHAPTFSGNEKSYVCDTIESTFVSSVGTYVNDFENLIEKFTGTKKAIATVNGTAALHTALYMSGVQHSDYIITQALTFVATCNAIHHMGANPIFIDIDKLNLSLCPKATEEYLTENAFINSDGHCIHKKDYRRIKAIMPMHTFGHPADLDPLLALSKKWNLILIEDAAESLGSYYKEQHTGTIGEYSAVSFNGNKVITTGGGGMVLCKHSAAGKRAQHITTTAKVPHPYEFFHDEPGFNYRLPNLNAALGCAQMERLPNILQQKRILANKYCQLFKDTDYLFVKEPSYAHSNYWLNAILCPTKETRDLILQKTNESGVMTRPIWQLMHRLPMFKDCPRGPLKHSERAESLIINLPSSPFNLENNHD